MKKLRKIMESLGKYWKSKCSAYWNSRTSECKRGRKHKEIVKETFPNLDRITDTEGPVGKS